MRASDFLVEDGIHGSATTVKGDIRKLVLVKRVARKEMSAHTNEQTKILSSAKDPDRCSSMLGGVEDYCSRKDDRLKR